MSNHCAIALACALSVLSTAAIAQDRDADWVRRPTSRDLESVWPARALKQGYGGKATISCIVTVQGTLRDCRVVSETPADGGFGGAALALSPQFLMKPAMKNGAPVESTVSIPINFPRPDRATGSYLRPSTDTPFRGERVFAKLPWVEAPSHADVVAAYPDKARAANAGGVVALDCRIDKDGGLSVCRTMEETPDNLGFSQAAKSLASKFKTPVEGPGGESIAGSRAHLRVTFAAKALSAPAAVIGKPEWRALPAMDDFTAVIPPAARAAKVYKARVVMTCTVGDGGVLADCSTNSEEPGDLGYGDAARTLARHFRLAVWTDEGLPTIGGKITLPIRFDLEAAMAQKD